MRYVGVVSDFFKWEKFAIKLPRILRPLKTQRLRHVSKVGCNGDSDETDVKSGAITAQQGGLSHAVSTLSVVVTGLNSELTNCS